MCFVIRANPLWVDAPFELFSLYYSPSYNRLEDHFSPDMLPAAKQLWSDMNAQLTKALDVSIGRNVSTTFMYN